MVSSELFSSAGQSGSLLGLQLLSLLVFVLFSCENLFLLSYLLLLSGISSVELSTDDVESLASRPRLMSQTLSIRVQGVELQILLLWMSNGLRWDEGVWVSSLWVGWGVWCGTSWAASVSVSDHGERF